MNTVCQAAFRRNRKRPLEGLSRPPAELVVKPVAVISLTGFRDRSSWNRISGTVSFVLPSFLLPEDEKFSLLSQEYYGLQKKLREAWQYLFDEVYNEDIVENTHESSLLGRPAPDVCKVSSWAGNARVSDTSGLRAAAEALLKYYDRLKDRESYVADLVAVTRQLLADTGWSYVFGLNDAFRAGDQEGFEKHAGKLLDLFDRAGGCGGSRQESEP